MKHTLRHRLLFDPGVGAAHATQHLLLSPLSGPTQLVETWQIEMDGIETAAGFIDGYGNRAVLVNQVRPEGPIEIVASGVVETHDHHGVVGRLTADPVPALFRRQTALTVPIPALVEPHAGARRDGKDRIGLLHLLMASVGKHFATDTPAQQQGADSQLQSQDAAGEAAPETLTHAFVGAARALGIPARFVTGYLADADHAGARFHAWAEAYDDGLGWIGFDCLLNLCPTDLHVRVASGLDAAGTMPVRRYPVAGEVETLELSVEN